MTADSNRGEPLFHGWKMVGALSVILFFIAGGGFYVFPVFIEPLQAEFGWTMTQISSGAALFAIVMGFSNPVVGSMFARFGARKTMITAALFMATASLINASLRNIWMLYGGMLISGFAVSASTLLPAQTLITNWFDRFRGRAMGLTMLGIGFGGFLLPPFNEFLIRVIGWRLAWVVAAAVVIVLVIPLMAIFVRTKPSDMGLLPDGVTPGAGGEGGNGRGTSGLPVKVAVGTATFWLLVVIFLLQLIGVGAMNFHFVPFATQQAGFESQQAAFYYGLTVGFSIIGRLVGGWLADRWRPQRIMATTLLLLATGPALLEILIVQMGLRDPSVLLLYAIPFGIGIGGNAVVLPVLAGRCFGELYFSKIMGLLMSGFAIGVIVGIPLGGWIFDRTGSYELVFIFCGLGLLVASVLAATIRPERYHADFVTEDEPEVAPVPAG